MGKITSYDSVEKYYKVKYDDEDEEEYTKTQVNKYLIPLKNVNVRKSAREKRQVGDLYGYPDHSDP